MVVSQDLLLDGVVLKGVEEVDLASTLGVEERADALLKFVLGLRGKVDLHQPVIHESQRVLLRLLIRVRLQLLHVHPPIQLTRVVSRPQMPVHPH